MPPGAWQLHWHPAWMKTDSMLGLCVMVLKEFSECLLALARANNQSGNC